MKISELAKLSGVNLETIRYYERLKLITPAKRDANGYRSFGQGSRMSCISSRRAVLSALVRMKFVNCLFYRPIQTTLVKSRIRLPNSALPKLTIKSHNAKKSKPCLSAWWTVMPRILTIVRLLRGLKNLIKQQYRPSTTPIKR